MSVKKKKFWGWGSLGKFYDDFNRPKLWPFLEKYNLKKCPIPFVEKDDIVVPPSNINHMFMNDLKKNLRADQIYSDKHERLVHTYNQAYIDLLRLRKGIIERSPDLVIYPEEHSDVKTTVDCANKHNVCIIPYGGGTNVARGTEPDKNEKRMIVIIDLTRMNKIISIDKQSRIAKVEAGITGEDLEVKLNEIGFTCGHDPDSIEFSTLGGWIASRSSGMLSNKYGDMSDLLVSATMVTPVGTIKKRVLPATSAGPDFNHIIAGSEGAFGIITEAVIHIFKIPEKKVLRALLFPSFEAGIKCVEQFVENDCLPALVRVLNPEETWLSASTSKKKSFIQKIVSKILKQYLKNVKRYDFDKSCFMFLGFEGNKYEVNWQYKKVLKICKKYKAFNLGSSPAKAWDESKYDLALLRDLIIQNGIMTEACETATIWSNIMPLYNKFKNRLTDAMKVYSDVGWVGCHLSHTYRHGACLYFIFACREKKGEEIKQYMDIKNTATEVFVSEGGTVSHHHSVGQMHKPYLHEEVNDTGVHVLKGLKSIFDSNNIMNPGKLIP